MKTNVTNCTAGNNINKQILKSVWWLYLYRNVQTNYLWDAFSNIFLFVWQRIAYSKCFVTINILKTSIFARILSQKCALKLTLDNRDETFKANIFYPSGFIIAKPLVEPRTWVYYSVRLFGNACLNSNVYYLAFIVLSCKR